MMSSLQNHILLLLTVLLLPLVFDPVKPYQILHDECQNHQKCGDLEIKYPYGVQNCSLNDNFLINCSTTPNEISIPYLGTGNLVVTDISLDGHVKVLNYMASDCYFRNGTGLFHRPSIASLSMTFQTISSTHNRFIAVGCDTKAVIHGFRGGEEVYTTGCISICNTSALVDYSACSGSGCCNISLAQGLNRIEVTLESYFAHTEILDFNPCSFAFVVANGEFVFNDKQFKELEDGRMQPVVLDWAVGDKNCSLVDTMNSSSYICRGNSSCVDSESLPGYLCRCSEGYEGNPYLDGCKDINECEGELNTCEEKKYCRNKEGSYACVCPKGYHGGDVKTGKGCIPDAVKVVEIVVGIGVGVIVVIIGGSFLSFTLKKRKLAKLKEKFFKENGGILLQEQLTRRDTTTTTAKIFSAEELNKATDGYSEGRIIGRGGYGTVYKGYMADDTVVAIKKSKVVDKSQIQQFINEVVILSQINHRNVVRLLGCCLETEVPLLVYEYVSNGTLFDHIHREGRTSSGISWEIRVKIATETAGVLSYLHSAASIPIIHRDIKPTNILLDNDYVAKVSDFGASRLVPRDQEELSTLVQGTLGYLDPEYLQTSQLTEKSDVYSFGVVLVELLTGKKALSFDRPEVDRSLAMHFLHHLKNNQLLEIVDDGLVNEGNLDQVKEIANVAKRCLRLKGEERPSMKEVAMDLEGLRMMGRQYPWVNNNLNNDETAYLLGGTVNDNSSGMYDSMQIVAPVSGDGR